MSVGRSIGLERLLVVEASVQYQGGHEQAGRHDLHIDDR